jgi:transcriptional regulator with XRE-family HTH domain
MSKKRTIGGNLKRLREARDLSQQALAIAAGLSVGVVSHTEQGQAGSPRIATLSALARALGVRVEELLAGTEWEVNP